MGLHQVKKGQLVANATVTLKFKTATWTQHLIKREFFCPEQQL
jgi:hypothetical protein